MLADFVLQFGSVSGSMRIRLFTIRVNEAYQISITQRQTAAFQGSSG
jgi:hypothetical protein